MQDNEAQTSPASAGIRMVQQNRGLQATGLGKSFASKRVVRNITLNVNRGEAVGLLGPNGAGQNDDFLYVIRPH